MKRLAVLTLALFLGAIVSGVSGQSAASPITSAAITAVPAEAVKSGVTPVDWVYVRPTYYRVRPTVELSPRYVRPTYYLSPRYVRPTYYLSPRYVRPTYYLSPRYVRPTYYLSPRYVRPTYYLSPRYVRPTYYVSPTYYAPYVVSPTLFVGTGTDWLY